MMSYSILVNTCDKFEDCWNPFFKLLSVYWPDCQGKLYLNTEYKDYSYPGLNIKSIKGCNGKKIKGKFATWSQCLRWALETIDDDIVLYMQEDYFLRDRVKNDIVEDFVVFMEEHPAVKCLHLTLGAVTNEAPEKSEYPNLKIVQSKYGQRVSCQAALWRKDELLSLIRDDENAWEFEEFGSQRSAIMDHRYLVVDNSWVKMDEFEIIPYIFTGIIKGRWYEPVVPLFKANDIEIDYSKRGFVKDTPRKPLLKKIQYYLYKIPRRIKNQVELAKLRQRKDC